MIRIYTLLIISLLFTNSILAQSSSSVVINEVYCGGGNSGAVYKADFIKLYNNSNQSVDLSGWSVQYAASTGTTWQRTILKKKKSHAII